MLQHANGCTESQVLVDYREAEGGAWSSGRKIADRGLGVMRGRCVQFWVSKNAGPGQRKALNRHAGYTELGAATQLGLRQCHSR